MIPYYLLLIIPLAISFLSYKRDNKIVNKNFPLVVFFLMLCVLLSLRSVKTGVDLRNYSFMFQNADGYTIGSLFDLSINEAGFGLLQQSFRTISNGDFQLWLTFCALVSLLPIVFLYSKKATHPILTMALFVVVAPFSMFFSGLRQSLAIGIGVISFYFVDRKKFIYFLICVFIAFLIHRSAFVLLLLYPVYHLKIGKKLGIVFGFLAVTCFVFNRQIFSVLISFISRFYPKLEGATVSSTGAFAMVILFAIFGVFSFLIPNEEKMDKETRGFRNILLLVILIQCFAPIHTLAMRMNYYFLVFVPLLIPRIIDCSLSGNKRIANISKYVMTSFFIVYFFYNAYTGADILQIFPYVPFWEA